MHGYERYEHDGKILFIKFSKRFPNIDKYKDPVKIIIRFEKGDGYRYYHVPNKLFTTKKEIVDYFRKNQTSPWLKVKVIGISETL